MISAPHDSACPTLAIAAASSPGSPTRSALSNAAWASVRAPRTSTARRRKRLRRARIPRGPCIVAHCFGHRLLEQLVHLRGLRPERHGEPEEDVRPLDTEGNLPSGAGRASAPLDRPRRRDGGSALIAGVLPSERWIAGRQPGGQLEEFRGGSGGPTGGGLSGRGVWSTERRRRLDRRPRPPMDRARSSTSETTPRERPVHQGAALPEGRLLVADRRQEWMHEPQTRLVEFDDSLPAPAVSSAPSTRSGRSVSRRDEFDRRSR